MAGFDEPLMALEENTKVEHPIHAIKMINYSFEYMYPSFPPLFLKEKKCIFLQIIWIEVWRLAQAWESQRIQMF